MKKLLALLLAVAMLVTLCAACDKKSKNEGSANDPESVAEKFVKAIEARDHASLFDLYACDYEAYMQDNTLEDYDSEEDFFEDISEMYDEEIDSWKDAYKAVLNRNKDQLEDKYGSDYKIKAKASDAVDLDEEELEEVKEDLLDWDDYIDEDEVEKIKDAKKITVDASISGEDGEDEGTVVVIVVKYDGKWKVADYWFDYEDDYDDDEDYDYEGDYYDDKEYYYDEY
ncbi:MAG: hypothetical protein IJB36_02645 [Clostridia bacterium]|nr:hypothetical protein [Clostridia bacterium]